MAAILKAVSKSFRVPKLEDHVKAYNDETNSAERKRTALWGIRDCAERQKNAKDLVQLGVVPIMVKVLYESKNDERLWALWVLRFLADYEDAAMLMLQEPHAVEGLVMAMNETANGTEASKRAVDCVKYLSKYLSTQMFLAREDMFRALVFEMDGSPAEASAALSVYYTLSEAGNGGAPSYLGQMKFDKAIEAVKGLTGNNGLSEEDRAMAEKLLAHLTS